ncbi:MAG: hypothetical protein AAGF44_11420 [Pseudomonadota bacterium]
MRLVLLAALMFSPAMAGDVEIVDAKARESGGAWRFDVTLRHGDTGWDHYADAWRVVGPDGTVYGMRVLHHPHVEEQPFTRSLSGVKVPEGITEVAIEARDSVHGWAEAVFPLILK